MISDSVVNDLGKANGFRKYVGGQVTNVAINMAHLDVKTELHSCIGNDSFGRFICRKLQSVGLNDEFIQTTNRATTSLSIIARQTKTPDFVIYRGADSFLQPTAELRRAIPRSRILHTSAFALSRNPARTLILDAIEQANMSDTLVSLDPNYHPSIWPDTHNFLQILADAYQYVQMTKPSLDDCHRLFGDGLSDDEYASRFLAWGPKTVVLTKGSEGVYLACADGGRYRIYPSEIKVSDVTGAGDAFWAGLLRAWLSGATPVDASRVGQALAEMKIQTVGQLGHFPPYEQLLDSAQSIRYEKLH